MGRRLLEQPPSLEERLGMLANLVGLGTSEQARRRAQLTPDELALRRALDLRGY